MLLIEVAGSGDLEIQGLADTESDESGGRNSLARAGPPPAGPSPESGGGSSFYEEVRRFETELIRRALRKTGGHQARAARLLGLHANTLNSMMKRYDIRHDDSAPRSRARRAAARDAIAAG